jgi:acetyltransferase-like isoleucine patch superfamily enzyme
MKTSRLYLSFLYRYHAFADSLFAAEARMAGVTLGPQARFEGRARILVMDGTIAIGEGTRMISRDFGYHTFMLGPCKLFTDAPGASISIGNNCMICGSTIHAKSEISIGNDTLIGTGVIVDQHGHSIAALDRVRGVVDDPKPIRIGNRCWIGHNNIVLKGVTIGDDVVVGAGSVVTRDLPAGTFCAGQPAKPIRELNPADQVPGMMLLSS